MVYQIKIKSSALKNLSKLPMSHRRRVAKAISKLAKVPKPMGSRKLSASVDSYRIRVGNYRIVYQIADNVMIVYVVRVAHRKDVYRGL